MSRAALRVLVTGASGYFGTALLPRLTGAGYQVTALSRSSRDARASDTLAVDLCDVDATRRVLTPWRWDAVVHLAGPAPKAALTWDDSVLTINAHVRSLVHLISAIPDSWQGRFVHASGAIVYGRPTTLPVTEDHPRRPMHAYALAKSLADDVLLGSKLTDRFILRMGGLFSEARRSGALFNFVRAAKLGEPLEITTSSPPVPWEIIHVDDAVEGVVRSLSAPTRDPGALNLGYGEPIHIVEIAERFARRSPLGSSVVVSGPNPPTFHLDISRAREVIAFPPATLDERLDELWSSVAPLAGEEHDRGCR